MVRISRIQKEKKQSHYHTCLLLMYDQQCAVYYRGYRKRVIKKLFLFTRTDSFLFLFYSYFSFLINSSQTPSFRCGPRYFGPHGRPCISFLFSILQFQPIISTQGAHPLGSTLNLFSSWLGMLPYFPPAFSPTLCLGMKRAK